MLHNESYKWVICLVLSIQAAIYEGMALGFGVLVPDITKHFSVPKDIALLLVTLNHGAWNISGVLVCPFAAKLGFRLICVAGSFLAAFSMVGSTFCDTEIPFMLTFGLMAGLGSGASVWTTVLCLCRYFEKTGSAMPIAISFAFGSLGTLAAGTLPLRSITMIFDKYLN